MKAPPPPPDVAPPPPSSTLATPPSPAPPSGDAPSTSTSTPSTTNPTSIPTPTPAPAPASASAPTLEPPNPTPADARPPPSRMRPPYTHLASPITLSSPAPATAAASSPTPAPAAASSSSSSAPAMPRGGVAVGAPSHHPRGPQTPAGYTGFVPPPPLAHQFGSLHRGPDQPPSSTAQLRQPIPGIQNIGMIGSLNTSQMRPGTASGPQQPRPGLPTMSTPSPSVSQMLSSQQTTHGLTRPPSISSPSPSQALTQSQQNMPSPFRTQQRPQVLQPRPYHLPQSTSISSHQQSLLSAQQQKTSQVHHPSQQNQQTSALKNQQQLSQQQPARTPGPIAQKPDTPTTLQAAGVQSVDTTLTDADAAESGNRLLSKRSIRELVAQVDPSETLDSEVEDVLIDIAEEFVEDVLTFSCSLAKHRKSNTLEAKDILLHAERSWNITLPGFSGDEIKLYKKQHVNDIHKERLALIKKSMAMTGDGGNTKNSAAQAASNHKNQAPKPPVVGSP